MFAKNKLRIWNLAVMLFSTLVLGLAYASEPITGISESWWKTAAGLKIVTLKKGRSYAHTISLEPVKASKQLDHIKTQGFQAIEIFAPAEGLYAYSGLDTKNHYRIDPELGTMDDFRRLVRIAHNKGLAVIIFYNIGYFSLEAPDWIEACKDKRANKNSDKVKWFLWTNRADAPSPGPEDAFFLVNDKEVKDTTVKAGTWGWQYSKRAGCYYWARWQAKDKFGNYVGLPQNNWASEEWPKEAERIVRFWMDTGIDGMIIDAPIFYAGCTWKKNNQHITNVIASYGNTLRQPEAARDVAWIIMGNYNCLQDYGISFWHNKWNKSSISYAFETGDPRHIEESLRNYHDVIVADGEILYKIAPSYDDPLKRHIARATIAAIGDLLAYNRRAGNPDAEETWILKIKQLHPALHQLSTRQKLKTNADNKYYLNF